MLLCKFLVLAITTGRKSSSRLSGGLCCCGSGDYDQKKKSSSRLSGELCCCGSGDYNREKKVPVICLAGCAVVLVFGSGGKLTFFL